MKKIIGISIIATSLLTNSMMAEEATPTLISANTPTPPSLSVEVIKDEQTNKAKEIEYKVKLVKGWNLLGLPGYKPYVLNDLFGNKELVNKIYVFNSETQEWQNFATGETDASVKTLLPGMGYWIEAKQPFAASFRSNIPSQKGTYEKAAIRIPQTTTTTDTVINPLTGTPVMVSSVSYDDAFNDDGTIKADFLNKSGTMDWNNLNLNDYSEDSWDDEFIFDIDLLDGAEFTDQVGRTYRFLPLNEKGGKVVIVDNGKEIDGKFLLGHKGDLEIQLKKKANRVVGGNKPNDGEVAVTSVKDEVKDKVNNAGAPVVIRFDLILIEESSDAIVLRLKNLDTNTPSKWTLTKIYDEVDNEWVDAKEFLMDEVEDSDITLSEEEWDALTSDDSSLSTLLESEDIENYADEELTTEFEEMEDGTTTETTIETTEEADGTTTETTTETTEETDGTTTETTTETTEEVDGTTTETTTETTEEADGTTTETTTETTEEADGTTTVTEENCTTNEETGEQECTTTETTEESDGTTTETTTETTTA